MKSKVQSKKSDIFAKGGKTKMHGKQHAGPQKPGTSGHSTMGNGGKWAKGGGKKMAPFTTTKTSRPGKVSTSC